MGTFEVAARGNCVTLINYCFYKLFSCFMQTVRSRNRQSPREMIRQIKTVVYSRRSPQTITVRDKCVGGRSGRDRLSAVWDVLLWHRGIKGRHKMWVTKICSRPPDDDYDCDVSCRGHTLAAWVRVRLCVGGLTCASSAAFPFTTTVKEKSRNVKNPLS